MQEPITKNKLLQIASVLMIVAAVLAILLTALNILSFRAYLAELDPEQSAALQAQLLESGLTAEQAATAFNGMFLAMMGLLTAFNLVKIVVGALGLRKTAEGTTFYIVWGAVLLVFGVLSIPSSTNLLGLCNAVGGLAAPALFLMGGSQNKKRLHR